LRRAASDDRRFRTVIDHADRKFRTLSGRLRIKLSTLQHAEREHVGFED
jgi:hypothetical protein